MKLLNIGSMNIDMVYAVDEFIQPGETKSSKSLQIGCGGKGLNQSIAASRAGNEVWHAGLVGNDGVFLLDELKENGVNVDLVSILNQKNGHAVIQVNNEGQNCILLYRGTNGMFTKKNIDGIFEKFPDNNAVLLQNEINELPYIICQAKKHGHKIFLNAAPMDSNVLECPLELLDWLLVNEIEGRQIAGCAEEHEIIPILSEKYPNLNVLLTLGSKGAVCKVGDDVVSIEALKVPVVDTTAAGDTFCGYFIYGILAGESVYDCLKTATSASAVCVSRPGAASSVPYRHEIKNLTTTSDN